jgi:hypothetical protein
MMAGKARDFVKQVHGQHGYWLNYPPAQPIKLGDIVIREGGVWIPIGSVTDRGVQIETTVDDASSGPSWTSSSEQGVEVKSSLDLDPGAFKYLVDGELGARVSFASGSKYLLALSGVRFDRVKSIEQFWKGVKSKYSMWTWDLRNRIVTSVCHGDSGTFLGSGDSAATYELKAEAGINVPGIDIGKLATGFSLVSTSSSSTSFVGLKDVTPLFRLHRATIFGSPDAAAVQMGDDYPQTDATELVEDDTKPDSDD